MSLEKNKEDKVLSSSCTYICVSCKKSFTTQSNLGRHMRYLHKDQVFLSAVKQIKKPLKFTCETCNKGWSHKKNFNIHLRKYHGASPITPGHSCAICKNAFGSKNINQHLETEHEIDLKYENHEFATFEEFSKWKSDLEKNTRSMYVKYANWKKSDSKCNIYQCHRSGKFYSRSRAKGLRRLKEHGSNKINAYCPASIKVTESEGQYSVSYQTTHVGHQNDLGHLKLSDDEKKFIALKIAAKIPFDKILEDIRDNIPNSGLERIHLLTRKDLQNIVRSLKSGKWAQDIEISNETSFKIIKNEEETCSQSSIKGDVGNEDDICIESSFEVYEDEDEIFNESQSEAVAGKAVDISYESPAIADILNKVEISHASPAEDYVGNGEVLCTESSQEFIGYEGEISHESPEIAAFGNGEILWNESSQEYIGKEDGIPHESPEKAGNEIKRIFKDFAQANLSFQERLCSIQNEYLDLINSVSLSEELDVLENNLKSLKADIDATNVRKAIVVNLTTKLESQHPIHATKISKKSVKKHKKKLPENLFRKLRKVQNENEMVSLIMSYKNQSSDISVIKLEKA